MYFALGTDPDMATVNVQNRVSQATSLLPQEVIQSGITVRKQQNTELLRISFGSVNPAYDETFLQNYAQINILPQLKRIPGVSDAISWSIRDYSMRLWLKSDVMASYGIAPSEVLDALRDPEHRGGSRHHRREQPPDFPIHAEIRRTAGDPGAVRGDCRALRRAGGLSV